ncbi:DUF7742 family protein [Actibacterium lipolyticum]|uniref:DUF7742 domain-containing protein n=1 Tax=Actibacterium lipolyticum TaxID=1524263 RepID=A0A238KGU5_9RHOB|nr:hypothetical protein [Actibacterium lipolyticum]SMX42001.1 hypothetical protein COL8621_01869 [Actibacterium lipolyticum]
MRPVLHGDVVAAARVLLATPASKRSFIMAEMLSRASAADAYRKRFGRAHFRWGNGSLMAVAYGYEMRPEPFLDDADYCSCLAQVFDALKTWRSDVGRWPRK